METSLNLLEPASTATAGRSPSATGPGTGDPAILFASTLQQELAAASVSDEPPAAALPATSLRGELSEWLRSLKSAHGATLASQPGAEAAPAGLPASAGPPAPLLCGPGDPGGPVTAASADAATADSEPVTTDAGLPAEAGLLPAPAATALPLAGTGVAALLDQQLAQAGASAALPQHAQPTTALLASQDHSLPASAAAATATPEIAATAGTQQRDTGPGAGIAPAAPTAAGASHDRPGADEFLQRLQGVQGDPANRLIQPQPVLAPALDGGLMQQVLAAAALRQADAHVTPGASPSAASADAPFSLQSVTPAGTEGWGEEIGSHISWLSEQKISKAELSLHPAELGAIDITINNEDERVTVTIVTRNEAARELLQDNLPRLAELLRNNGLALEQGSVSQHGAGRGSSQDGPAPGAARSPADENGDGTASPARRAALLHPGQIDHYV